MPRQRLQVISTGGRDYHEREVFRCCTFPKDPVTGAPSWRQERALGVDHVAVHWFCLEGIYVSFVPVWREKILRLGSDFQAEARTQAPPRAPGDGADHQ